MSGWIETPGGAGVRAGTPGAVTLRITPQMAAQIREATRRTGETMAALLRRYVDEGLAQEETAP